MHRVYKTLIALAFTGTAFSTLSFWRPPPAIPAKIIPIPPPNATDSLASLIRDGDDARNSGDFAKAARLFKQATILNPRSLDAWLRLGDVEVTTRNLEQAQKAYKAAESLNEDDPDVELRFAELFLMARNVAAAIETLEHALKKHKDDARLNDALGIAYTLAGYYDAARRHYQIAMKADPGETAFRNNYGLLQLATGDLRGALSTFLALTHWWKTNDQYRVNLALVYLALGRRNEALANAPGLNEHQLRQMLAAYYPPKEPKKGDLAQTADGAKPDLSPINPSAERDIAIGGFTPRPITPRQ